MKFLGINLSPNWIQITRSFRAVGGFCTAAGVGLAKVAAIGALVPALAPLGAPLAVFGAITAGLASCAHDVVNVLTASGLDTQGPK